MDSKVELKLRTRHSPAAHKNYHRQHEEAQRKEEEEDYLCNMPTYIALFIPHFLTTHAVGVDTIQAPTHLVVAFVFLLLARTDIIQDATLLPRNDHILVASPALLDAAVGAAHAVNNVSHQVPVWDVSILVHCQVQGQVTQIAHRLK